MDEFNIYHKLGVDIFTLLEDVEKKGMNKKWKHKESMLVNWSMMH